MSENQSCCCGSDLPWSGRGASLDITGCRFSLYPMDSRFVPIILEALEKTDTAKVWVQSDALSTVYRGRLPHVIDSVAGLFIHAAAAGVHMALEGQLSKGCPGDIDGDSFLSADDILLNQPQTRDIHFPVKCKIALYPLGCENYIDYIAEVFRMAEKAGLKPATIHYATRLEADVHEIMRFLQEIGTFMQDRVPHYVLTFTLSINSPTEEEA